jgi:hypothetical protein
MSPLATTAPMQATQARWLRWHRALMLDRTRKAII